MLFSTAGLKQILLVLVLFLFAVPLKFMTPPGRRRRGTLAEVVKVKYGPQRGALCCIYTV